MAISGPTLKREKGFGLVFWYKKKIRNWKDVSHSTNINQGEKRGWIYLGPTAKKTKEIPEADLGPPEDP